MKPTVPYAKEFTGRHMLVIMIMFFGTIITVNIVMATYARTSWTGLVVSNSYVASQEFNEKTAERREQLARQWTSVLDLKPGKIRYQLTDKFGHPVIINSASITFRRPAYEGEDTTFNLGAVGHGVFGLDVNIRDGIWIVETSADIGEVRPYLTSRRIVLSKGVIE